MDYELPTDFDIIIVGTGMVESIVSAAASRIGKTVLHIDRNDYYGGLFASFNMESFINLSDNNVSEGGLVDINLVNENENIIQLGNSVYKIKNIKHTWHIPDEIKYQENQDNKTNREIIEKVPEESDGKIKEPETEHQDVKVWFKEHLLKESRKFNIDLNPKVQYARGNFIELLISSNIARYSEYRNVNKVLTWLNDHLEVVPCSRSDIFANNKVSVIEKRMMMKFLTSLEDNVEQLKEYETKSYKSFLSDHKLSKNLIHYILYAISNSDDNTLCPVGIQNTKMFLKSLGRFGKTPFLYSMFGSGDLPQEFCRLSAVFGTIYALGQPLHGLSIDNNKFKSLFVGKQRIQAKHIVMGLDQAPEKFVENLKTTYISRAVLVTNKSIMNNESNLLTLLLYPPENGKNKCTIIELPYLSSCCPKDTYLVHITCDQISTPEDDLKQCIENLFTFNKDENKPQILFSTYFSLPTNEVNEDLRKNLANIDNLFLCPGPDCSLDYDLAVGKAKEIFMTIYPDAEFLPRAPDPEEIKFEGDDENNESDDLLSKTDSNEADAEDGGETNEVQTQKKLFTETDGFKEDIKQSN